MATRHANTSVLGSWLSDWAGTMAVRNLYGPGVRMGNWNEDVFLEEVRMVPPRSQDPRSCPARSLCAALST